MSDETTREAAAALEAIRPGGTIEEVLEATRRICPARPIPYYPGSHASFREAAEAAGWAVEALESYCFATAPQPGGPVLEYREGDLHAWKSLGEWLAYVGWHPRAALYSTRHSTQ